MIPNPQSALADPTFAPPERARKSPARYKVMHIVETLGSGGAERLLASNLRHFDAYTENVVVTVYARGRYWEPYIQALGVPVISLGCKRPRDLPGALRRLRRLIAAERPDLIHTHLWAANILGRTAGKLSKTPVISSIHNPDHEPAVKEGASFKTHVSRGIAWTLDRWTAKMGCELLIAVSEYVRQSAHRTLGIPLNKIELIYNSTEMNEDVEPEIARRELIGAADLRHDAMILLNVGRVAPQKGLIYAIRALPHILQRIPTAHLVSIGSQDNRDWTNRVRDEIQRLSLDEHVTLLGERRDVSRLIAGCDIFVFPSVFEGFGIALLEAMALGKACVATATCAIPELITHRETGWLVQPRTVDELADAVIKVAEDHELKAKIQKGAASRAKAFDAANMAAELQRCYARVLADV